MPLKSNENLSNWPVKCGNIKLPCRGSFCHSWLSYIHGLDTDENFRVTLQIEMIILVKLNETKPKHTMLQINFKFLREQIPRKATATTQNVNKLPSGHHQKIIGPSERCTCTMLPDLWLLIDVTESAHWDAFLCQFREKFMIKNYQKYNCDPSHKLFVLNLRE